MNKLTPEQLTEKWFEELKSKGRHKLHFTPHSLNSIENLQVVDKLIAYVEELREENAKLKRRVDGVCHDCKYWGGPNDNEGRYRDCSVTRKVEKINSVGASERPLKGYSTLRKSMELILRRPLRPGNRHVKYQRRVYSSGRPFCGC